MANEYQPRAATRLEALEALEILDTLPEERFERFTRLAALTFDVPMALVSLVDADRQWFKSKYGVDFNETPRSVAICNHVVGTGILLVVEYLSKDVRFRENPLVLNVPNVRFYAGLPLHSAGHIVGSFCIMDTMPRSLSAAQLQCLADLGKLVETEINQNKNLKARYVAEQALLNANTLLEQRVNERTAQLELKLAELSTEVQYRRKLEQSLHNSEAWGNTIIASSYSGFIAIDQDGLVIEWNPSAERIFGWSRQETLGKRLSELIVPIPMRDAHEEGMRRRLQTGVGAVTNRNLQVPAITANGNQITIDMTISDYNWQGTRCFGAFMTDISERVRAQQQLEEKQELLDAVLDSIDVAVLACDANGKLSLFNRAAETMYGVNGLTMSPEEWAVFDTLYRCQAGRPLPAQEYPLYRSLAGDVIRDLEVAIELHGERRSLLASGRPLRNKSGRGLGAVVAMKDVTELDRSREELAMYSRRMRAITENLPAMIGQVDAAGNFTFLNGRALDVFGRPEAELIGRPVASAYSVEEYAALEGYLTQVARGEVVFFEHDASVANCIRHYQCCFVPQRLSSGRLDGFFAMAFDISERKLSELQQAESEERLRTITNNVPVLISYLDDEQRYTFANAVHGRWLGVPPSELLGRTMSEALGNQHFEKQSAALARAWQGQTAQCEHDIVYLQETRSVQTTYLPHTKNGEVIGIYSLTTDATAARLHERRLHALAHTDALTGLPNRRQFEEALTSATGASRETARIALMYLDVDFFKQINDTHGHSVGDQVLVEFAQRLRSSVRASDLVARLAGDEFTVLLYEVRELSDVEHVAEKILSAINSPFIFNNEMLTVSTTIGAAITVGPAPTAEAMKDVADQALYSAKAAGRNRYAVRTLT